MSVVELNIEEIPEYLSVVPAPAPVPVLLLLGVDY